MAVRSFGERNLAHIRIQGARGTAEGGRGRPPKPTKSGKTRDEVKTPG